MVDPGALGTAHLPADRPVAVLIGAGTYSSGEALAYPPADQGQGSAVRPAHTGSCRLCDADPVTRWVVALIPEATTIDVVSGTNWAGAGVVPDVPCAAADPMPPHWPG